MLRHAPSRHPRRVLLPAAALLCASLSTPAAAEAMRVADLGAMTSRVACLETAARALDAYIAEYGGYATSGDPENPEEWAYYGWELRPGTNDVVILCPTVAGQVNAYLTVHAAGDDAPHDANMVAERIRALWDGLR